MYSFDIQVSVALLNRVYARRIFKHVVHLLIAFALIALGIAIDLHDGDIDAFSQVGLVVILLTGAIFSAAWVRQRRGIRRMIKRLKGEPIRYSFTEDRFAAESILGRIELKWSSLSELEITNDSCLICWEGGGFVTLPTEQIPPEALAFLIERFQNGNLPVKDSRKTQR